MNYSGKSILRGMFVLAIASASVLSMGGCKKSSPLGPRGCEDVARLAKTFSDATKAFIENPSVDNCQKMKEIGDDYLKAARNCNFYPEYREQAEEVLAQWNDMDCSEAAGQ